MNKDNEMICLQEQIARMLEDCTKEQLQQIHIFINIITA